MSAFNQATEADLAYFRSVLGDRVFSGDDISDDLIWR